MKMEDVFMLPVEAKGHRLYSDAGSNLAEFSNGRETDAAAHAINCHDELVEFVRHVASLYDETYRPLCQERRLGDEARAILNKVKGTDQ